VSRGAPWHHARRWLPWLAAAAILALMAARVPAADLRRAFATGPSWAVALCSVAVVAVALAADSWATLAAFAVTGIRCPWRELLLARGASYLLGLLGGAAGQGGMGIYLHRAGVAALRAVGTVLFLLATQVAALAVVAAAGVAGELAGSFGAPASAVAAAGSGAGAASAAAATARHSLPLLALLAAAFLVYLAVIGWWQPAWLTRHAALAPAFAAGGRGFVRAVAARLPHVAVMTVGLWLGLRLWGVPLPFFHGLVVISVAVLVTVVPLVPSGLGTLELAVVDLVAPYAPAAVATQRASVLACTLVYHLFSLAAQAAVGLLCLALLARRPPDTGCRISPLPAAGRAPRTGDFGARPGAAG
jgi:hypothetical protein